jgi:hypothetical protein
MLWKLNKKVYAISIHGEFASVLCLKKKGSFYQILEDTSLDLKELPKYLQDKSAYYIVIDAEEALDEVITVPAAIKKSNVLKSYILKRFKDSLPSKNILLNFNKLSEDKEESTVTYKVDAIDQKTYLQKLELFKNFNEIKSATIEKFALLSLTRKCFTNEKDYGYFSVYTHGNVVTVLAIDENNDLLFERRSTTVTNEGGSHYLHMVEEVNQTVAYVKQQFRSTEFSTILLAGSLAFDDKAAEHLLFSTSLKVAVLYPNTFVKGLENEELQHYIITLGAIFVHRKERFLPGSVYRVKEYHFVINALLIFSGIIFGTSSFFAYTEYLNYTQLLKEYDTIKSKLIHTIKITHTYPMEQLEKSYKHLQIAENFLLNHPSDYFIELTPLIKILAPTSYTFNNNTQSPSVTVQFQKSFGTLKELYTFRQNFLKNYKILNKEKKLTLTEKTDYTKLYFAIDISSQTTTTKAAPQRRRRR